jgi:hypothetical protein
MYKIRSLSVAEQAETPLSKIGIFLFVWLRRKVYELFSQTRGEATSVLRPERKKGGVGGWGGQSVR